MLGLETKIVDLSWDLNRETIFWPGGEGFELCMKTHKDGDSFYAAGTFSCAEHGGTHVDAPFHFNESGSTVDQITLPQLVAPARVIDICQKCEDDSNYQLSVGDIEENESQFGRISKGSVVLIRTGWHKFYPLGPRLYLGFDEREQGPYDPSTSTLTFPGIGIEAAQCLVERSVSGVGLDTASLDPGSNKDFLAHRCLLGAGIYGIENLSVGIASLSIRGCTLCVMPLKITGGSGSPARVVAFCPPVGQGEERVGDLKVPSAP